MEGVEGGAAGGYCPGSSQATPRQSTAAMHVALAHTAVPVQATVDNMLNENANGNAKGNAFENVFGIASENVHSAVGSTAGIRSRLKNHINTCVKTRMKPLPSLEGASSSSLMHV
jgi:hypothetical protein